MQEPLGVGVQSQHPSGEQSLPPLSDADIIRAKMSADLGAYGRKPYENKFIQTEPRLLELEKDYFFNLLAAKELGIDSKIPRLDFTALPKNLTPEQQRVYDSQIQLVKQHYKATQVHLQATASNKASLKSIPGK